MARGRPSRASSTGSYQDGSHGIASIIANTTVINTTATTSLTNTNTVVSKNDSTNRNSKHYNTSPQSNVEIAKTLLYNLLYIRDSSGRSFLHCPDNLHLAKGLLQRCIEVEEDDESLLLYWQFVLQPDKESGYTPLHAAIVRKDLAMILFLLRGVTNTRLTQRPMTTLLSTSTNNHYNNNHYNNNNHNNNITNKLTIATDWEGLTPLDLLGKLQQSELYQCRKFLQSLKPNVVGSKNQGGRTYRTRQSSFSVGPDEDNHEEDDDATLSLLRQNMHILQSEQEENEQQQRQQQAGSGAQQNHHHPTSYACEVVTFGRPQHCALGVISSSGNSTGGGKGGHEMDSKQAATFCPQRVQEFSQERVLRHGSAMAVAAATHHTLVACRNGHLYVFGLNKGGRLGLGDNCPQQCPLPRRIVSSLKRRRVVGVAAAENHSLCVTSEGMVWAWGSNRFGQLGENPTSGQSDNDGTNRSLPKRVEELKDKPCVAVAAGERHSVALSSSGEVYVWGDNTSGQLGVARRTGVQKVQRVEALWNNPSQPRVAIAIAAAEQSTLVLTEAAVGLSSVNSVYSWGHGNHVPIRIQFERSATTNSSVATPSFAVQGSNTRRLVNPVAIACAKYHNAAVTSDGRVYTWGTSSECLGRDNKTYPAGRQSSSSSHRTTASPQLVTGMLPENGGGFVVAISASEQHTAVVTDTGALFTWGAALTKNVMGHEGVRWQPSPKRVPGVHRAVDVAVAKEHTVLLIGSTFPSIPPTVGIPSLEELAAREVAQYVDLFNAVPLLIMAERTECETLIKYCSEFVRRNLDGVLNVAKKTDMDQYLDDMLADSLHRSGRRFRDGHHHPIIADVVTAGSMGKPTFERDWLSSTQEWIQGCVQLSQSNVMQRLSANAAAREVEEKAFMLAQGRSQRSSSCASLQEANARVRSNSVAGDIGSPENKNSLDKCIKKTSNMDLSTAVLADEASVWLNKEIRGIRKKLTQITKLQESEEKASTLTPEERAKVSRRHILESELTIYETALKEVGSRIQELSLENEKKLATAATEALDTRHDEPFLSKEASPELTEVVSGKPNIPKEGDDGERHKSSVECKLCGIRCPDQTSFELHQNGRKHRNRQAQVDEEEKRVAAQSIMEQKQLAQIKESIAPPASAKPVKKNAWGVPSPPPKYTLPPPPHPVVPPVTAQKLTTPPAQHPKTQARKAPAVTANKSPSQLNSPVLQNQSKKGTIEAKRPQQQPSPVWATPTKGSTLCVPLSVYETPGVNSFPIPAAGQRNSFSLADFLTPQSPPVAKKGPSQWPSKQMKAKPRAWSTGQESKPDAVAKTLVEIQTEELDFNTRQDRAYGEGGGCWFLERKERAGSLHAIQQEEEKEREHQLLVEEQLQIEKQILEELARQRQEESKSKGDKNRTKRGKAEAGKRVPKKDPPNQKQDSSSSNPSAPPGKSRNRRGPKKRSTKNQAIEHGERPREQMGCPVSES